MFRCQNLIGSLAPATHILTDKATKSQSHKDIEITSWVGARTGFSHELVMYQKSNERAERASEISDTNNECENPVQAPCL